LAKRVILILWIGLILSGLYVPLLPAQNLERRYGREGGELLVAFHSKDIEDENPVEKNP